MARQMGGMPESGKVRSIQVDYAPRVTMFAGHNMASLACQAGLSDAEVARRELIVTTLAEEVESRGFRFVASGLNGDVTVPLGLLESHAIVVVIDEHALRCPVWADSAKLIAWRMQLGLPVVLVLPDGLTLSTLAHSPLTHLAMAEAIEAPHDDCDEAMASVASRITEIIAEALRARHVAAVQDPAVQWAPHMAWLIEELTDDQVLHLATYLRIPPGALAKASDARQALMTALFTADTQAAFKLLRQATDYMKLIPAIAIKHADFLMRSVPLWVDLDHARILLHANNYPRNRRICGVHLPNLEQGSHVVKRASASSVQYDAVRLHAIGGENLADELIRQHDATLREALHIDDDAMPDEIKASLEEYSAAVFALFDCSSVPSRVMRDVLKELTSRFPGITWVLVAPDEATPWRGYAEDSTVVPALAPRRTREVSSYIGRLRELSMEAKQDG